MLFFTFAVGYAVLAILLVRADVVFPDSVSRLANGYYVLFSRDPHLPAVGFVWNPLPSIAALPLLSLKGLFPSLVTEGLAGGLESALFMAWSVALLAGCLRALGVTQRRRIVLTLAYALHPMIVLYGGSGQSEAPMLCFLLLATRCLVSWLADERPQALVGVGVALGLAYWTRYEAVGPAVTVVLVVGAVSHARAVTSRLSAALTDMTLAGLPFVLSFVTWAVASKVLVGSWFETFTSAYGNSAQVAGQQRFIDAAVGEALGGRLRYTVDQIVGLQPLVALLLITALALAGTRRDPRVLAPLAVLGAVLAFDNLAFFTGASFGWLRFQITVIPLAVLLAGAVLTRAPGSDVRSARRRLAPGPLLRVGVPTVVLASLLAAVPVSLRTLADHRLAREETVTMLAAWRPAQARPADVEHLHFYDTDNAVAEWLDALRLPEGAVLADAAYAYQVVLRSQRPKQFVITPDRDFAATLDDPAGHGVRYLLVASAAGTRDALEEKQPGLYATGAGAGRLVSQWQGVHANWRLYAVQ